METEPHSRATGENRLLAEAANWLVRMQSGEVGAADHPAFERWRNQSPAHIQAWQRAEEVLSTFARVPAELGRETLRRLPKSGRRQALRTLGMLLVGAPAAWLTWRELPWSEWTADVRTAIGERKGMGLADGSRLVLNTASAVNIVFTARERRLELLAGEILITSGRDPSPVYRPLIVQTTQGTARALGTRFTVRRDDPSTQVCVFDGAVEIQPADAPQGLTLRAGEQTTFRRTDVQTPRPVSSAALLWEHGMFVAQDIRLADLVVELSRYRDGVLHCDPAVADVRVSGALPVNDIDAALALLQKTLPIRVTRLTRYWVTLEPR